jgi:hypothetical protein
MLVAASRGAPGIDSAFAASGEGSGAPSRPDDRFRGDNAGAKHFAIREARTSRHRANVLASAALPGSVVAPTPPPLLSVGYASGLASPVPQAHVAQHGARSPPVARSA